MSEMLGLGGKMAFGCQTITETNGDFSSPDAARVTGGSKHK